MPIICPTCQNSWWPREENGKQVVHVGVLSDRFGMGEASWRGEGFSQKEMIGAAGIFSCPSPGKVRNLGGGGLGDNQRKQLTLW